MKKIEKDEEIVLQEKEVEIPKEHVVLNKKTNKNVPVAIREDESLREENKKVFEMSDGTMQAVFYPEPVHFYDKKNKHFVGIDNTVEDEKDGKHIRNKKNSFIARFSKETDTDELFSVESDGYAIKISIEENLKRKIKNKKPKVTRLEAQDKAKVFDHVTFDDIENLTDFDYTVHSDRIKEDIIIKNKRSSYKYGFIIEHKDLDLDVVEEEKKLSFKKDEKEIFSIPAPFMYDAIGTVSTEVYYEIEAVEKWRSKLTIIADDKWINSEERVFPVIIDPQIVISGTNKTTTYGWSNDTMTSLPTPTIGNTSIGGAKNRMYMKIATPELAGNPRIKKVEVTIRQSSCNIPSSEIHRIGAYKVTDVISSGACQCPNFEEVPVDYARVKSDSTSYVFDITKVFDDYYNGIIPSLAVVFKMMDETVDSIHYVRIHGSSSSAYGPTLTITYENTYGMPPASRCHTHDLGRFGTASIDLQTGALHIETEDFAWQGIRKPVTIKHYYSNALRSNKYTKNSSLRLNIADFSGMSLGYGWRLNYMQSMIESTFVIDGESITGYIYTDETGNEMYFKRDESVTNCMLYKALDGSGYEYCADNRRLTKDSDYYIFDYYGRLKTITDGKTLETKIEVVYDWDGKITKIIDGIGRTFTFGYTSNSTYGNYLTSITSPSNDVIKYTYSNGKLYSVSYPSGQNVSLMIATDNSIADIVLKEGTSKDIYRVSYSYGSKYGTSNQCVKQVTEYGYSGNSLIYGRYALYTSYASSRNTKVQVFYNGNTAENKTFMYSFDEDGNVISNYKNQGIGTTNIPLGSIGLGIDPFMSEEIDSLSNVDNLLLNHSFEQGSNNSISYWYNMNNNLAKTEIKRVSTYKKFGKNSVCIDTLKIKSEEVIANGIYQTVSSLLAGKYTFSVYFKLGVSVLTKGGFYIRVSDVNKGAIARSEYIRHYTSDMQRVVLPFEITATSTLKFEILLDGSTTVYVDAAQLEKNDIANDYNILENGGFESSTLIGWDDRSTGVSVANNQNFNMQRSMSIAGSLDLYRYAKQEVIIDSGFGVRDTYSLSGWAKAPCIDKKSRDDEQTPIFRLKAVINYENSEDNLDNNVFYADFSPYTEEWQLATVKFCKSKHSRAKSIDVYCEYGYSVGTAYFDNIQLFRTKLESGLDKEDFEVKADDSTIIERLQENLYKEEKDEYGNNLTKTMVNGGELGTIYEASEYSSKSGYYDYDDGGNDIISGIDQRGNKTLYDVDYLTSRCQAITDRLGNKTKYQYDRDGRITKMTVESKNGEEISGILYYYNSLGNLSRITRCDGQTYLFTYNQFNRLQNIGTYANNILTYEYGSGNGRIAKMTYANGDYVKFTYNSIGKVSTEIWYDKSNKIVAEYSYIYDLLGNIVKSIDKTNKIEYNYIYENGQIIKMSEIDTTTNNELFSIVYSYDNRGKRISKIVDYDDNKTLINSANSTKLKDQSVRISYDSNILTSNSKSDKLYRKATDELVLGEGFVSRQYIYHYGKIEGRDKESIVSSPTTDLVSQIVMSDGRTISYEYDNEEHITKVTDSKGSTVSYLYNELGELVEEIKGDKEIKYTYDACGNILSKDGVTYVYDENWKELLIKVGNNVIEYDAQGNPTTYLGNSLTWEKGKNLKTFGTNSYTYNANGVRIAKTVNGITHRYSISGTTILREKWNDNTLIPLYDNEDIVCGIIYNSTPYYFLRDLHNNVIAITDKVGKVVAEYEYDAWGACTIKNDATDIGIATINPFRYRSYYYDTETKLYYLNCRYYDPEIGRFISADNIEYSIVEDRTTINLYSYCGNDPVNNVDTSGHFFNKAKDLFNKGKAKVKEVAQKVTNFVKDVADDVQDFVEDVIDSAKDVVEKVSEKAQDALEKVTGTVKDALEKITGTVKNAAKSVAVFAKKSYAIANAVLNVELFLYESLAYYRIGYSLATWDNFKFYGEFLISLITKRTNVTDHELSNELAIRELLKNLKAADFVWENGVLRSHKYLNQLLKDHYYLDYKNITIETSNENLKTNLMKEKDKAWKDFGIIYSQYIRNDPYENLYAAGELVAGNGQSIEYMGCELIAVYNAGVLIGRGMTFPSVIFWFEQNNGLVAGGNFGTNPYKLADYFKVLGINYVRYDNLKKLVNDWNGEGTYIISVWNNKDDIFGELHTYAVESKNYKLTAYNHQCNWPDPCFEGKNSFDEVIQDEKAEGIIRSFICGYKVWKENS